MIFIKQPFLELEKKLLASIQLFEVDGESLYRRLEFISKHNLELFTHFERLQKTHELIEKNLLVKAKETIERCRHWVEKRDSKSFSVHYDDSKVSVNLCVTSIRKWLEELKTIMEPEMMMKGKIAETKDHLRALRVAYFKHANALQYVENKFVYAFKTFDDRMLDIEKWLDSGNYEDIDMQLTKLKKIAIKLIDLTEVLPPLCAWIYSILPEKITQLKQTADAMVKSGFPIHHLLVNDTVTKIEDELVVLDQKLHAFELVGLDVAFKDMLEKIDTFYPLFEKEKAAQIMVDSDYETTYERVNRLEKV
jgi:septation ring formation regulator EzrA